MHRKSYRMNEKKVKSSISPDDNAQAASSKPRIKDMDIKSSPNKFMSTDSRRKKAPNIPIIANDPRTQQKLRLLAADSKYTAPVASVKFGTIGEQIYPIRLFCMCEEALGRAFTLSRVGIKWKDVNMSIYEETAKRLKRVYNYYKQYPDGVIEQYRTSMKPGVIIYSKQTIKNVSGIQIYNSKKTSLQSLGQLLKSGRSIRIQENLKFEGYEMYVYKKEDWPDTWYQSLPEWTDEMSIESSVLDVFNTNSQVIKLGSASMLYGLPQWYRALENAVTGIALFDDDGILINNYMIAPILCNPVSPYKSNKDYVGSKEKMDAISKTACLVVGADRSSQNYDAALVDYAIKQKYYVLLYDTFAWIKLTCNGSSIIMHCKLTTDLWVLLQDKVYVNKAHDPQGGKLFFDLIFKSYKPNTSARLNVYRGMDDRYEIRFIEASGGLISASSMITGIKGLVRLGYPNVRMSIIGSKGSLKSAFIKYLDKCAAEKRRSIKCFDSDAYGVWVSKMKGVKVKEDEVDKNESFIYKMAEAFLQDCGVSSYFHLTSLVQAEALNAFGILYQKLLQDEKYGIRQWIASIKDEIDAVDYVLFFLHSNLEQRTMYPTDTALVLKEYIDPQRVIASRTVFKSDVKGIELMLFDFYSGHINPMMERVDYIDILRLLEFNDVIGVPSGGID